jgi:hypothetical protein
MPPNVIHENDHSRQKDNDIQQGQIGDESRNPSPRFPVILNMNLKKMYGKREQQHIKRTFGLRTWMKSSKMYRICSRNPASGFGFDKNRSIKFN